MSKSVIVTGGSGYVGQRILGELLSRNYKVIAIVRSQKSLDTLNTLFQNPPNLIFEIVPELDKPNALDHILQKYPDVEAFISGAAVVKFQADDFEKEVITPTIDIVKNTLTSIKNHAPQIKKVIFTSSAVVLSSPETIFSYDKVYSDNDWTPVTRDHVEQGGGMVAYFVAKKLSEQAAWEFKDQENPDFDIIAIQPTFVVGPAEFDSEVTFEKQPSTAAMIVGLLNLKPTDPIPVFANGWIDIRDVAKAHVDAIESEKYANQRVLLEADKFTYDHVVKIIVDNFPEYKDKLPKPNPVDETAFVKVDDSRSRGIVGFEYKPLENAVVDLIKQLHK
ncbi:GRP2 putative NADPH-dependent methylglyoxal reductase GRP2 [Candida maltosa Xu316]|uniref:NADPH-dependent methylglyoxal reductase, putative (D-lactaldehyde dehydrogenase, putative) n=1 Tax=Candida maltosa (strain Xu316) TaxID=1245528 RepID=M3JWU6_CANMX|nr:NADPH-dependent methylglyoxal reductase, putative (D-lactaldehyde dehydrogenase, putative) [Candida maltosa Xu316]